MEELYCIGCGIKLQCEDETKEGYVNPNAMSRSFILCKRCYQLKHYGKFVKSDEVKNTIQLLHASANKNDLILLICDVALVYTPLIKVLKEINSYNNVVLVANRYDLYKDYISKEKAMKFLQNQVKKSKINIKKIFICDEDNIDEIFDFIDANSIDNNAYLLGVENAGKTTFINKILKVVANEDKNFLTNSKYPGTTVDLIKIPLDDNHYLIDSPGVKSKGNILNFVEFEFIKKIQNDVKIKPIVFQLNSSQSLLVSNILKFDYVSGDRQGIVFHGSSMLDIIRCKLENSKTTFNNRMKDLKLKSNKINQFTDLTKIIIENKEDKKIDIVIEGLGFFSVKKGVYYIHTFKGVNVFTRDAMI